MDFELSDMQQMIVDSAERLITAEAGLDLWRDRRALADGVNPVLWNKMAELGWLALTVPEDAGGLGGSMEDAALLMVELGKGIVTEPVVSSGILAARILDRVMVGDTRAALLGAIATGETKVALAHTDPEAASVAPLAARRAGESFVLDGHKVMVFDAPSADQLLATATLDGQAALFLVDAGAQGVSLNTYPLVDGSRAADVAFSGVMLDTQALLATGTVAASVVEEGLDCARVALIAQAVGAMEAAVKISADYAKERQQFGQPIGKFQAIQHIAADMFVASFQARSALYAALRDIDGNAGRRSRVVAMAKVVSGMAGQTVSRNGIQIHGGYGITDEYAISHYYRRLMVLEKQYGSIDAHAARLATIEVGA